MPGQAPPLADERDQLLAFLTQQRDGLRNAAYGLTDAQARLAPTPSSLSIGGLIKHAAQTERTWMGLVVRRDSGDVDYEGGFALLPGESLGDALAELEAAALETQTVVSAVGLEDPVPVPQGVPWFPSDVAAWTVRWVLLHLIEEFARHAGHGDVIREAIDGATMYELMAAAEGWPATEWLRPWEPATQRHDT
jgi:hypothetical protein